MKAQEWSPHIEAAAKAMYKRLNVLKNKPKWRDLDLDATDHYCIAAELAVKAFFESASATVDGEAM